jgi:uncharacterized surface protein with fasciclin (FAS1) repeats
MIVFFPLVAFFVLQERPVCRGNLMEKFFYRLFCSLVAGAVGSMEQEQRNGILYEFYRIMKNYATNFMENITGAGELTLLAPSNEAFRRLSERNLNSLLGNQQKLTEVLQLHVIRRRLSSDEIIHNSLLDFVSRSGFV